MGGTYEVSWVIILGLLVCLFFIILFMWRPWIQAKKLSILMTFFAKRCASLLSCICTWEKITLQKSYRIDKMP